jgi:O-antigen/teichoic acid export membrane protein
LEWEVDILDMFNYVKGKTKNLLLYTQQYTKLDHIYLAKNGIWAYSYYATSILLGIAVSVAFARFSDKATYGYYQYIAAIVATFAFLSLPGMNTAILRSVSLGYDQALLTGIKTRLSYSFLSVLALSLASGYYQFIGKDPMMAKLVLVAAIFFPATFALNGLFSYFNAKKQFFKLYALEFLMNLVNTSAVVLSVVFLKSAFWVILFNFASYSFFNIWLYFYIRRKEKLNENTDNDLIPYGKKLTLIGLIPQIFGSFDQLVIPHFLSIELLAVYTIAIKIPSALKNLLVSINPVIFPRLVEVKSAALLKKIFNVWIITAFLLFTLAAIFFLPFAIHLLFGTAYLSSIRIAQVYSLSIIPIFLTKVIQNWSLANKESSLYFKNTSFMDLGSAIFTTGALLIFHSLMAVVIAKVLANILTFIYALALIIWAKQKQEAPVSGIM